MSGVLPLCRHAVGVFYNPSLLDFKNFCCPVPIAVRFSLGFYKFLWNLEHFRHYIVHVRGIMPYAILSSISTMATIVLLIFTFFQMLWSMYNRFFVIQVFIINTPSKFLSPVQTIGFSQEIQWQQVSSGLHDSYKYCPVGWGCRIHRLLLCGGIKSPNQRVSWIWH